MPNPENIKGHEFQKGKSGNPKGRPKGSRSLSSVLKEMLEEEIEVRIEGQAPTKKPFKEVILRKLLKNASDGKDKAISTIFDRVDGKPAQFVELSTPEGRPLEGHTTHEVIFRDFSKPQKANPKKKRKRKPPQP